MLMSQFKLENKIKAFKILSLSSTFSCSMSLAENCFDGLALGLRRRETSLRFTTSSQTSGHFNTVFKEKAGIVLNINLVFPIFVP